MLQKILHDIENTLAEMHQQQCAKAQQAAHRICKGLTAEDLLNPDNFPEVISNPDFMYEDGLAAGILSAKLAVRARLLELGKLCLSSP